MEHRKVHVPEIKWLYENKILLKLQARKRPLLYLQIVWKPHALKYMYEKYATHYESIYTP